MAISSQMQPMNFLATQKLCATSVSGNPVAHSIAVEQVCLTVPLVGREGRSSVLKAHTGTVRCVNFSADGKLLITAGDDKTVKVRHTACIADNTSSHQNCKAHDHMRMSASTECICQRRVICTCNQTAQTMLACGGCQSGNSLVNAMTLQPMPTKISQDLNLY